jgi:hypothetical protein
MFSDLLSGRIAHAILVSVLLGAYYLDTLRIYRGGPDYPLRFWLTVCIGYWAGLALLSVVGVQ